MKVKYIVGIIIITSVFVAQAAVINVNYYGPNGAKPNTTLNGTAYSAGIAPVAYTGTQWNDESGFLFPAVHPLLDSEGNATGVTFEYLNPFGNSQPYFTWSGEFGPSVATDISDGFLAVNNGFGPPLNGPMTLRFGGLNTNLTYNFTFISNGDMVGQGGAFTLGGITKSTSGSLPTGPYTEGENYVSFNNLSVGSSTLDVDFAAGPNNSGFAMLNGFQIEAIPEPSTMALLGVFGGGLFLSRRKRFR